MNRREIDFPLKDAPLREDVSTLGALVGEVLEEQGGERLLNTVETARIAAIGRREGDAASVRELARSIGSLSPGEAQEVVRAFSTYFQVTNLAEQVHCIRRRREELRSDAGPQAGSLEDAVQKLAQTGQSLEAVQMLLDELRIEPVFTAHPTEATRRTILEKHLRIAQRLVERLDPSLTQPEGQVALARIRTEIASLWQTEEYPSAQRTVSDELEHVLFYITDILYRIVPPFYEALEDAFVRVYGSAARRLRVPPVVRFASWVGGDMDGNPNVSAETIRSALNQHRRLILGLYQRELDGLYRQLSQSLSRVDVSRDVLRGIDRYALQFFDVFKSISARHHDMPYRLLIRFIQARLSATGGDEPNGYAHADAFVDDLRRIASSLTANKGIQAGLFAVRRLIRRAQTFGFHLAALDIRQDALVHKSVVGKLLGEQDWAAWPPEKRAERLLQALETEGAPGLPEDDEGHRTLAVFRAIADCRTRFGARAIGPYIISMARNVDDVLTVLLLARWGGLVEENDRIPLDVAPLFETVSDLDRAPGVMAALLACPAYRRHLAARQDRQMVMIGYSDSNKDGGFAAARWALRQAQAALVDVAEAAGVDLVLFHGRGGTISRGGGDLDRAVLSSPCGTMRGRLRVTEQGEIIHTKYGLRGTAMRELERTTGAVALSVVQPMTSDDKLALWKPVMETIAEVSRRAYRALVYEHPGFFAYFRQATPIDVIERMQIGSRPSSRRSQQGIQDLRAIPWVFAWTQSRHMLPGWFGLGAGLEAAVARHTRVAVADAVRDWPFLNALLAEVEEVLGKADMDIAAEYARLAGEEGRPIFSQIRKEYDRTVDLVLKLNGTKALLEKDAALQRSIVLRNPYIDPISMLQVDLLHQWRATDRKDDERFYPLLATVNGIAEGLQNTG